MSSISGYTGGGSIADTRRKQNKRDEAIRKKIEGELARKRTISTTGGLRNQKGRKAIVGKGTVAALKPSPALTVPETISVSDASQLCAAKRTDCVLVVDDEEGLCGIFTAKDLAYRVTAESLDPRTTPVSAIMTRNPMVTRDTTSATEALQLMVQRHFRHLPVCNEDGNVVGLLDITKVFHEALAKVERSSTASEKLYSALEGVQSELGNGLGSNPQAAAMLAYVESLREKTALPDLTTVMDSHTQPATVGPRTTVLHPNDSASVIEDDESTAPKAGHGAISSIGGTASQVPAVPVDDGTYVFKFRTPSGRTHRFQARNDNIENLHDIVAGKLSTDPFFTEWDTNSTVSKPDSTDFQLQYTDADGDIVVMSSDTDVEDAVKIARTAHMDRVVLIIQGGKGWEAGAAQSEAKAKEVTEAAIVETKEVDKAEAAIEEAIVTAPPAEVHVSPPSPAIPDDVLGIPRDLILPASIGALAVVIIGIFTISRLTRD
ncbi:hypothetical protein M422DRAFT_166403 [Sphaerobolus stellatus SS14]|uniref:CBS domain-containing protein n=1 Tax=Sphaerobolus stellatus (strain SS14) TaxID=990650 RepID=A0A0C9W298_SPHS4|nr:hypothetical protein M422DRAFT_166403 [Sphaerobolus stellatus SS14]